MQVLQLGRCREPLTEDGAALEFYDALVPIALGTGRLAGHLGAAVIPVLMVLALATVHYVVGVVLGRALGLRTVNDALARVRHPSATLPFVLFAFPFAVMNAATIVAHGEAPIRVQGIGVLLAALLWWVYCGAVVLSDDLPRLCAWIPPAHSSSTPCVDRFITQGRWYSRPHHTYVRRYGYLFREARPGRTFVIVVDLFFTAACSILAGLRPVGDPEACDAIAYSYVAVAILHASGGYLARALLGSCDDAADVPRQPGLHVRRALRRHGHRWRAGVVRGRRRVVDCCRRRGPRPQGAARRRGGAF
ncbi:MAG: hypothetical protein U5N85_20415 [Arcicella sp.]|nr:hypothetical protein [Arcicella sp.]